MQKFRQINDEFIQNREQAKLNSHVHFTDLRRQIDIRRAELKVKIDEIALEMIQQANEKEKEFYQNIKDIHQIKVVNFENEIESLEDMFRKVYLNIEQAEKTKLENEIEISHLEIKIRDLNLIKDILENGFLEIGRNSEVLTKFGTMMKFSLKDGTLPLLTTKKVAWRVCFEELFWFISDQIN